MSDGKTWRDAFKWAVPTVFSTPFSGDIFVSGKDAAIEIGRCLLVFIARLVQLVLFPLSIPLMAWFAMECWRQQEKARKSYRDGLHRFNSGG